MKELENMNALVECVKLVKHLIKDKRSINALEVAERFANHNATLDELKEAAAAADAAAADAVAFDTYSAAAACASHAVAACFSSSPASTDLVACYTAAAAATIAYGLTNFAYYPNAKDEAANKMRKRTLEQCADIIASATR